MLNTKMNNINFKNNMNMFNHKYKNKNEITERDDESFYDEHEEMGDLNNNSKFVINKNAEEMKKMPTVKLLQNEELVTEGWQPVTNKKKKVLITVKKYKNPQKNVKINESISQNHNCRNDTNFKLDANLEESESNNCDHILKPICEDLVNDNTNIDHGYELKFKHSWRVYVHQAESNDWSVKSFDDNFYVIDSIGTFLQFFNNFYKFNTKHFNFFIMKSLDDLTWVEPTWEHEQNRNGGTCSIRIDSLHGVELMQQLCLLIMNESMIQNSELINGISYGVKTNWALIKIWTNNKVEDIVKILPNTVIGQYTNLNIRFKMNIPEY